MTVKHAGLRCAYALVWVAMVPFEARADFPVDVSQALGNGRFGPRTTSDGVPYLNTSVLGGAAGVDASDNAILQVRVDSPTGNYGVRLFVRNNDGDGGSHVRITNDSNGARISFETNDPPDSSTATDNDPVPPCPCGESNLPSVTLVDPGNLDASSTAFPFVALDSPGAGAAGVSGGTISALLKLNGGGAINLLRFTSEDDGGAFDDDVQISAIEIIDGFDEDGNIAVAQGASVAFVAEPLLTKGGINCGDNDDAITADVPLAAGGTESIDFITDRQSNVFFNAGFTTGAGVVNNVNVTIENTTMPEPLFESARTGDGDVGYLFRVEPGRYEVRLFFAEISPTGITNGESNRVFNGTLDGEPILTNFRIGRAAAQASTGSPDPAVAKTAVSLAFQIDTADNELTLELEDLLNGAISPPGEPSINAVSLVRIGDATGAAVECVSGDLCRLADDEAAPPPPPPPLPSLLVASYVEEIADHADGEGNEPRERGLIAVRRAVEGEVNFIVVERPLKGFALGNSRILSQGTGEPRTGNEVNVSDENLGTGGGGGWGSRGDYDGASWTHVVDVDPDTPGNQLPAEGITRVNIIVQGEDTEPTDGCTGQDFGFEVTIDGIDLDPDPEATPCNGSPVWDTRPSGDGSAGVILTREFDAGDGGIGDQIIAALEADGELDLVFTIPAGGAHTIFSSVLALGNLVPAQPELIPPTAAPYAELISDQPDGENNPGRNRGMMTVQRAVGGNVNFEVVERFFQGVDDPADSAILAGGSGASTGNNVDADFGTRNGNLVTTWTHVIDTDPDTPGNQVPSDVAEFTLRIMAEDLEDREGSDPNFPGRDFGFDVRLDGVDVDGTTVDPPFPGDFDTMPADDSLTFDMTFTDPAFLALLDDGTLDVSLTMLFDDGSIDAWTIFSSELVVGAELVETCAAINGVRIAFITNTETGNPQGIDGVPNDATDRGVFNLLRSQGAQIKIVGQLEDDPAFIQETVVVGMDDIGEVREGVNFDMVMISNTVGSGNIGADYIDSFLPQLNYEFALIDDNQILNPDDWVVTDDQCINISNNTHPITQGLPLAPISVYTAPADMYDMNGDPSALAPGATILSFKNSKPDRPSWVVMERGGLDNDTAACPDTGGCPYNRRHVSFFLNNDPLGENQLNNLGKTLMTRSICWLFNQSLGPINEASVVDCPAVSGGQGVPIHPNTMAAPAGSGSDQGMLVGVYENIGNSGTGDGAIDNARVSLDFFDPNTSEVLQGADFNDLGSGNGGSGSVVPDAQFPGLDVSGDNDNNNFGVKVTGLVEFPAPGDYEFAVGSDDGFNVLIGGVEVGRFGAPRGHAETRFTVTAIKAGLYPLDVAMYENAGGASFEFLQIVNGTPVLANDTARGAVAIYQSGSALPANFPYDQDGDGQVGQSDFDSLEGCFTGADVTIADACLMADFDLDFDVDCDDLNALAANASSGTPPEIAECAGGGPAPTLVNIMAGVNGAVDTWISPLGEDVAFDTVDLNLSADATLVSGAGLTLISNGGGNHTLTLDTPVPPGDCVSLSFDVADAVTGAVGTIGLTLCHLPLDVNQDGQVGIGDITAWGAEFNAARRASLVDTTGDGSVNVQDATSVGNNWFGRPPATRAWNGAALP